MFLSALPIQSSLFLGFFMSWSALRGNLATQGRFGGGKYALQDAKAMLDTASIEKLEGRVEYTDDEDEDVTSASGTMSETDNEANHPESEPRPQPEEGQVPQETDQSCLDKQGHSQPESAEGCTQAS